MERLELALGVRQNFLSAQWLSPSWQGWALIPSCWSKCPEGWAPAGSILFTWVFPFPCTRIFAPEEGSTEVNGACPHTEDWCASFVGTCGSTQMQPIVESFPQSWPPQIQCHAVVWTEQGWNVHLARAGVHGKMVMGNPVAARAEFLYPASGASQCMHNHEAKF